MREEKRGKEEKKGFKAIEDLEFNVKLVFSEEYIRWKGFFGGDWLVNLYEERYLICNLKVVLICDVIIYFDLNIFSKKIWN